jgi:hypothetical protein
LAHNYVDYANTKVFVWDIRESEKEADAEDAKGYYSSQDEEETKDADNASIEAPAQRSTPGGCDASIPSAGSGTSDDDISTATAPPAGGSTSTPAS